jgi:hypothetical protein
MDKQKKPEKLSQFYQTPEQEARERKRQRDLALKDKQVKDFKK